MRLILFLMILASCNNDPENHRALRVVPETYTVIEDEVKKDSVWIYTVVIK